MIFANYHIPLKIHGVKEYNVQLLQENCMSLFWHNNCMYKIRKFYEENRIMVLSAFMPSVTGMDAQSHAIGQVSSNIANISTVGYKTNETMFYSLLGSQPVVKSNQSGLSSSRADITGVGYYDRTNIDQQGVVTNTSNNFDVAINGTGNAFFSVRDRYSGDIYYTRAGNFSTQTTNGETYLVNGNGLRVQGFPALEGGGFGGTPQDIVLNYLEKIPSTPTTKAEIIANVPADGVGTSSYGITVYGPNNDGETMNMLFTKVEGKVNTWEVTFTVEDGTVTSAPIEAVFDGDGQLISPKNFDVTVNWNDGTGNNIAMDISKMTQYAGSSGITKVNQDGAESGNFIKSYIGQDGVVQASYSNGKTVNFAKLALSNFQSPDNLIPVSGTLFEVGNGVGAMNYLENSEYIVPQALEQSTATAEKEFSKMLIVQRAYTLNSSSFTVNNEMLETVVSLKT